MIRQLSDWNGVFSFVAAVLLNSLLVWLVLKRSPKEMHQYSRILLQTIAMDVLLCVLMELVQPIMFVDGGAISFYLNGPLARRVDSPQARFALFDLWLLCYCFTYFGLSVQFLYRFLVLVKRFSISLSRYLLMLSVPLAAYFSCCIMFAFCAMPTAQNELIQNAKVQQILQAEDIYAAVRPEPGSILFLANVAFLALLNGTCCLVTVVCGHLMAKYVRKNTQEQMADLNGQITRNLLVMSIVPLTLSAINISLCLITLFLADQSSSDLVLYYSMLAYLPMHWLPVFNPLATILTVRNYRRTVMRRYVGTNTKVNKTVVVLVSHVNANRIELS